MRKSALFLATMLLTTGAAAHELKVATWNIEHLRDGIGEGPNPRDQADFDRLMDYAETLDADVIAFQEVENQAAAERVFDPAVYQILISNRSHTQRTGFAVRKSIATVQNPDFSTLDVTGGLRHGTDITIMVDRQEIRLLSVHLNSGCFDTPLTDSSDACQKLNQQVPVLETSIDARAGVDLQLINQAGDTTTPAGKALFGMLGVFAEFERALIRERVCAGLARAREKGTKSGRLIGRPQAPGKAKALKLLEQGLGVREVARRTELSPATVSRLR
jgi:hypothetical protein